MQLLVQIYDSLKFNHLFARLESNNSYSSIKHTPSKGTHLIQVSRGTVRQWTTPVIGTGCNANMTKSRGTRSPTVTSICFVSPSLSLFPPFSLSLFLSFSLSLSLYIYIYIYICMYVCMYVCMYTRIRNYLDSDRTELEECWES